MMKMTKGIRFWWVSLVAAAGFVVTVGCGPIQREVVVQRSTHPDKTDLLRTRKGRPIRVCVSKVNTRWRVECDDQRYGLTVWEYKYVHGVPYTPPVVVRTGLVSSSDGEKDARVWESYCRSAIAAKLQTGAEAAGVPIDMVDRDALPVIVCEEDLRSSGIVDDPTGAMKPLGVDLLLFGTVDVVSHYEVTYKRDVGAVILNHAPYVPSVFDDGPKRHVRRTITVAGNFRAVDARTGKQVLLQNFASQKHEDKKPIPVVGTDCTRADLMPEERFVRESLEVEVARFVGRFVPASLPVKVLVQSSDHPDCIKGVELLDEDPAGALRRFESALAKDPRDDRAAFGAGVALERIGRLDEAKRRYELAGSISGLSGPR